MLPAHAQATTSPDIECSNLVLDIERQGDTNMMNFSLELSTEADQSTDVDVFIRSPMTDLELNNSNENDVVFEGIVEMGSVSFGDEFQSEHSFTELEVDVDIGADQEIDCEGEVALPSPVLT